MTVLLLLSLLSPHLCTPVLDLWPGGRPWVELISCAGRDCLQTSFHSQT